MFRSLTPTPVSETTPAPSGLANRLNSLHNIRRTLSASHGALPPHASRSHSSLQNGRPPAGPPPAARPVEAQQTAAAVGQQPDDGAPRPPLTPAAATASLPDAVQQLPTDDDDKHYYVRAPGGELSVAIEEEGCNSASSSPAVNLNLLVSEILLLESARDAIVASIQAQTDRANATFASMQRSSPVGPARVRCMALMVCDALYWVLQWFALALFFGAGASSPGNFTNPIGLSTVVISIGVVIGGLEAAGHCRVQRLAVYAVVQGATIVLLYHLAELLWLFLALRVAVLVAVVYLRLAISKELALESAFKSMMRQQATRVAALTQHIDLVISTAQDMVNVAQQRSTAAAAAARAHQDAAPETMAAAGVLDDVQTSDADDVALAHLLHYSIEHLHSALRPLIEAITRGAGTSPEAMASTYGVGMPVFTSASQQTQHGRGRTIRVAPEGATAASTSFLTASSALSASGRGAPAAASSASTTLPRSPTGATTLTLAANNSAPGSSSPSSPAVAAAAILAASAAAVRAAYSSPSSFAAAASSSAVDAGGSASSSSSSTSSIRSTGAAFASPPPPPPLRRTDRDGSRSTDRDSRSSPPPPPYRTDRDGSSRSSSSRRLTVVEIDDGRRRTGATETTSPIQIAAAGAVSGYMFGV